MVHLSNYHIVIVLGAFNPNNQANCNMGSRGDKNTGGNSNPSFMALHAFLTA